MSKKYNIVSETPTQINIQYKDSFLQFIATTKNNFYKSQFNQLTEKEKEQREYLQNIIKPQYCSLLMQSNL